MAAALFDVDGLQVIKVQPEANGSLTVWVATDHPGGQEAVNFPGRVRPSHLGADTSQPAQGSEPLHDRGSRASADVTSG